jgi:hypothetical protein
MMEFPGECRPQQREKLDCRRGDRSRLGMGNKRGKPKGPNWSCRHCYLGASP